MWIDETNKNTEIELGPREINIDNVQYLCRHTKELKASQVSKALKFLKFDCIRYAGLLNTEEFNKLREKLYAEGKHFFIVLPLNTRYDHNAFGANFLKEPFEKDYNFSEYVIFKREDGTFECNCQGWQTKKKKGEVVVEGANCSHVLALYYAFKTKKFNGGKKDGFV